MNSRMLAALTSPTLLCVSPMCLAVGVGYVVWKQNSSFRHSLAPDRFYMFAVALILSGLFVGVIAIGRLTGILPEA